MRTAPYPILIIDDNAEDRFTFRRYLERAPNGVFRCVEAETAAQGRALWAELRPAAILLDYHLPDEDGLLMLAELLGRYGRHSCAVVMLTGAGDEAIAVEAMKLGAQDYLVKSAGLEQRLTFAVSSAIEKVQLYQQVELQQRDLERSHAELQQTLLTLAEERALLAQRVDERTTELRTANIALARAAQLKDEFLASMSHELRTPLNAILGFTQALQDEIYGPMSAQQTRALSYIDGSSRHLLELITDILDLAKIGSGTYELDRRPTEVRPICEASLQLVAVAAATKQIGLQLEFDPAVTLLDVDPRRLKQMLLNLLGNAVKFTPAGGAVGLTVLGDAQRNVAEFTVWDTGIGIAADKLAQLFQPFVQLDTGLARQYEGTGLGLALVARMAELHAGGVSVASTVGRGSRFTIALPWVLAEPRPKGRSAAPHATLGTPAA